MMVRSIIQPIWVPVKYGLRAKPTFSKKPQPVLINELAINIGA